MKKIILSGLLMTAVAGLFQPVMGQTVPQPIPDPGGTIRANLSATRFLVNAPSSIAGVKRAAIAAFGGQPANASLYSNKQVVLGLDTLGATTLTNPTALAGKFALLYRGGGINFTDKAYRAQVAGAIALIIVNNVSGDPFAPGGTPTNPINIPVIMISDVDGNAINAALHSNITVTASLGLWSLGATHDLGIIKGYQSYPHALNIPLSQFSKSNNVPAYKNYQAGAIANFGTSTETGIVVNDTVAFTPTGGSTTVVNTGSYTVPSISPTDSVKFGFGTAASSYYLTPGTTTGRYDYRFGLTFGNTDAIPSDNFYTYSQYINDSIFCKGTYDYTNKQPYYSNFAIRSSTGVAFGIGPMFFVTNDGYAARRIQYLVGSDNTNPTLEGADVTVLLMKWVDGSGATTLDSLVEGDELTLVGFTDRTFTTADSSFKFYSSDIIRPDSPNRVEILDPNAWYWAAIQSDGPSYIGVDNSESYFTRDYAAKHLANFTEYSESFVSNLDIKTGFIGDGTNIAFGFPFAGGVDGLSSAFVDSIHYDRDNEIPAVALHISKNTVPRGTKISTTGVGTIPTNIGNIAVFPNPASSDVTVSVTLNKPSAKVGYRLFDVMGRMVYSEDHVNVQKESFSINTSSLASGNYYLLVRTDDGPSMQKVVIKK